MTNFEVKSIDGCANPYLVMASITAAGIDGLRRNLILPEPWENLGTELQRLPATLIESVEALPKGNLLGNLVGGNLSEAEIQVWKAEIDYHSQNKDAYKQQSYRTVLLNW